MRRLTDPEIRSAADLLVGAREGRVSLYGSYADHIANGCIVVGDPIPGWREVAFEGVRLRVTQDERELAAVAGCHPFDNPFLSARSERLGEVTAAFGRG